MLGQATSTLFHGFDDDDDDDDKDEDEDEDNGDDGGGGDADDLDVHKYVQNPSEYKLLLVEISVTES